MEFVHNKKVSEFDKNAHKDDRRDDLDDADDEELEDRIVEEYRKSHRPLNYRDINRLSRGNFDGRNLDMSVMSGVLREQDFMELSSRVLKNSLA